MSKIIYNKIIAKLDRLDEYLRYLSELQRVNKKDFLGDYHHYGLAERYLQLSIEAILDIGKLFVISEKLRKPQDNNDIFVVLHENKIISQKLADSLIYYRKSTGVSLWMKQIPAFSRTGVA